MNVLKLALAVVVLSLSTSVYVTPTASLTEPTDNTDDLQAVINRQSIALFMPTGIQIATEILATYDEGC